MNEGEIVKFSGLTLFGRRWYWRAVARNGRSVAIPGEGFTSAAARDHNLDVTCRILGNPETPIVDLDQ